MKTSLEIKKPTERLFGKRNTNTQILPSSPNISLAAIQHNDEIREKAVLEAERKKAKALTVLRLYTSVR